MSDQPTSIMLERMNRLGSAMADLMEAHAQQSRGLLRAMEALEQRLARVEDGQTRVERGLHALTTEQISLSMAIENAASRALRANIRLDDIEDRPPAQS